MFWFVFVHQFNLHLPTLWKLDFYDLQATVGIMIQLQCCFIMFHSFKITCVNQSNEQKCTPAFQGERDSPGMWIDKSAITQH